MKKCMYCQKENVNFTKEHVIPRGILDMFPEQDVTFHGKKDNYSFFKDKQGHSTRDVCDYCNNKLLGDLDGYGVKFIREYFLEKYKGEPVTVPYDFHMLQRWLLKITYNTARSSGLSIDWFQEELDYILYNDQDKLPPVSIFGGIHVDMSAFGEEKALL